VRLWKSWVVTMKDISVFRKNKYVFYSLVAIPLLLGIILPSAILFGLSSQIPISAVIILINSYVWYFVVIAAILPTVIASYSFVGEKIEKSLEPLLATPTTDGELLLGKSLAAFIPCMGATYIGATVFMVIVDIWSIMRQGTLLLPNVTFAVILAVIAPLTCVLSVEASVIISSRVNDVRAAQQLGGLVVLPLIFLVILSSQAAISPSLLSTIVSGSLAISVVALFYVSKKTFKREEILTKWK
jgi:ABC-2 type transport system permease protein